MAAKITKIKMKRFVRELDKRPQKILYGKDQVKKVLFSLSKIVLVKKEFSGRLRESYRLKKFYNIFNLALKQKIIRTKNYELKNYKYYKILKSKDNYTSIAKYYLRPDVFAAINLTLNPLKFEQLLKSKNKEERLSAVYTKRIFEKSGFTLKEFSNKLTIASSEFFRDALFLSKNLMANEFSVVVKDANIILQGYNPKTGKFIFTLIDPV